MSAGEAGRQIGYAAFPVIVLGIAIWIGFRMGKKQGPRAFVAWPVAVAAALLALGTLGMELKKRSDAAPPAGEVR